MNARDNLFNGAEWIAAPGCEAPAFSRSFEAHGPACKAVLRIAAPGFYEAWLDGRRVGDAVLDPSPSDFTKRIYFREYPLELAPGAHELRVLLGHGWYCQRTISAWNNHQDKWRGEPCLKAELLPSPDGRPLVVTDASWRCVASPLAWDDFREGEIIDPGFVLPRKGLADGAPATVVAGPAGVLQKADFPPARVVRMLRPARVWQPKAGGWIFDFGEDIAGWARMTFAGGRRGDVVTIRYDERVAPDGEPAVFVDRTTLQRAGNAIIWPENARAIDCFHHSFGSEDIIPGAAMQQDRFVLTGAAADTYEPRFLYHGFRYAWVRGIDASPDAVACEVRTDFPDTGSFECSSADFNALVAMADRSYKANFTDGVPTDCPHREKNGWTGDAQTACELAQYAYDNTAAYLKWCRDLVDAQDDNGNLPGVVPTGGWGYGEGTGGVGYGPVWGCAVAIVPWTLYAYRGVTEGLDICYGAMKRYADYEEANLGPDGLIHHGLGDWIRTSYYTGPEFVGTAYYHATLRVIEETARMKGLAEDATRYAALAAKAARAFNAAFSKGDGQYGEGHQTEQAVALNFGLVPEELRPAAERRLVEAVRAAGDRFDGGLVGTKQTFRALSRAGRTDLAFKMLMAKGSPGFMHMKDSGGTALWEDWWSGASRNHIMFGDFSAWARQWLCGIRMAGAPGSTEALPMPLVPGMRELVIAPQCIDALDWAKASADFGRGAVACEWRRGGGAIEVSVTLPPDTRARVVLPRPDASGAREHTLSGPARRSFTVERLKG